MVHIKNKMVEPFPLITYLEEHNYPFDSSFSKPSTISESIQYVHEGLRYLRRGKHPAAMAAADRCFEKAEERIQQSQRTKMVYWSSDQKKKVFTLSDLLDERMERELQCKLFLKRYYVHDLPDTAKIASLSQLYEHLYWKARDNNTFPRAEITANTHNRLVSLSFGRTIRTELFSPADMLSSTIDNSVGYMTNFI